MDHRNFRRELHTLKQQVSELSPRFQSTTQHMAYNLAEERPLDDPFTAQLQDVNAHVGSMEDTMRELKRRLKQPLAAQAPPSMSFSWDDITAQRNLTLPSGPVFWQLFNSLRSDLRTIDSRVADLERSVSDLEDRVDGLDSNRFTPTSSTATSEVGYTNPTQEWPVNVNNKADQQPCMLPEPWKDMNRSQVCLPIPAEPMYWPGPPPVYPNILHPHQELSACYNPYVQSQPQYEASLRSDTVAANSAISHLHMQNDAMQGSINKIDRENEIMLQAIRNLTQRLEPTPRHPERVQAELPSMSWPKPFEAPEVRFRDREIARMDELLRISQERLRSTEESIAHKDYAISQLRSERDEQRARESAEKSHQMQGTLNRYLDTLNAKNAEIVDLQVQVGQRNDALQHWQESWNELNDSYARADEQATAYKHAYYDSMVRADRDIQKISSDHDEEMTKLKEFCEEKDAVIQRQEDVIARGAKLLEQRDEEIESISRKLRAADDDRKHARRTQERLDRLLSERDAEIDQLKHEAKPVNLDSDRSNPVEPFGERTSVTWDDPLPVPDNQSWRSYPPPERAYEDHARACEDHGRACDDHGRACDDHGRACDDHGRGVVNREPMYLPPLPENHPWVQVGESALQFEKMRERRERRERRYDDIRERDEQVPTKDEGGRDEQVPAEDFIEQSQPRNAPKKRSKRQRRYSHRQYPELDRQGPFSPQIENWIPWRAETRAGVGPAPSDHGKQAFDDETTNYYWPPLPAPVTARRMASDANLHSHAYNEMGPRRNLLKYKSMQELPKRRLQAYVESEPESGGGREV